MMREQEKTAEEKLLRLIRQKNPSSRGNERTGGPGAEPLRSGPTGSRRDFFKIINRVLLGMCIILAIGNVYKFMEKKDYSADLGIENKLEGEALSLKDIPFEAVRPFSFYSEIVAKRNIFLSKPKLPAEETAPQVEAPAVKPMVQKDYQAMTRHLKLVGIILSQDPEAVIENGKTKETLFVHKGETMEGGTIIDIQEGKVVLRIEDQEIELTLDTLIPH